MNLLQRPRLLFQLFPGLEGDLFQPVCAALELCDDLVLLLKYLLLVLLFIPYHYFGSDLRSLRDIGEGLFVKEEASVLCMLRSVVLLTKGTSV